MAADGKTALDLFHQFHRDMVILDVNLANTLEFDLLYISGQSS
jgi:DNA-binding response OmpR family regulator